MQFKLNNQDIPLRFVQKPRARRISITIKPFQGILVGVPPGLSVTEAQRFVEMKRKWIQKALDKTSAQERKFTVFTENTYFVTRNHELCIERTDGERIRGKIENRKIRIFVPHGIDIKNDIVQLTIRKGIEMAWAKEANEMLPARIIALAKEHGLFFNKLAIKNVKSKWGSCTGRNDIVLSIHIVRLPDILIDYVLLHELVHTIHKNHGPAFWHMLNELTGDSRGLDDQLNHFSIRMY